MRDSVVLPAPDGDDSTSIRPRRAILFSSISNRARHRYSTFCTCSRNCSTAALSSSPILVSSTSFALAHSVLASRLSSWARKSSRRPIGPPCSDQLLRLRDMRRQGDRVPRARRPWSRSGLPPDAAGRDRSDRIAQSSVATCSASRARIASGCRPGDCSARSARARDLAEPCRQHPAKRRAFVAAHLDKRRDRFRKSRDHRGLGAPAFLFALLRCH